MEPANYRPNTGLDISYNKNIPGGLAAKTNGFGLVRDISNTHRDQSDIKNFLKQTQDIQKLLTEERYIGDNSHLCSKINNLRDMFLKCTKESYTSLSIEEKLILKFAFRDILDEVNIEVSNRMKLMNKEDEENLTGILPLDFLLGTFGGAFTAAVKAGATVLDTFANPGDSQLPKHEEDVLAKVYDAYRSLEKKSERFEKYESQLHLKIQKLTDSTFEKEFEQTLNKVGSWFSSLVSDKPQKKKIEDHPQTEAAIAFALRTFDVKTNMESAHAQKIGGLHTAMPYKTGLLSENDLSFSKPYLMWDFLGTVFHGCFQESEKLTLMEKLDPYTPDQLFSGKTFQEVFFEGASKAAGREANLFKEVGGRLSANLKYVSEDNNLAKLTINMNSKIGTLLSHLYRVGGQSSRDDLIKNLGYINTKIIPLTAKEFIKMAHEEIIDNIVKLCVIEQKEDEGISLKSVTNTAIASTVSTLIEKKFDAEDLTAFIESVFPAIGTSNPTILKSFLTHQMDKINAHRDLIVLILAHEFLKNMANIASEARQAERKGMSTDVSEIPDEKAAAEVKKSTLGLLQEARNFLSYDKESLGKLENVDLGSRLLFEEVAASVTFGVLNFAVKMQGSGGLPDVATPLYSDFLKKWTDWVSGVSK